MNFASLNISTSSNSNMWEKDLIKRILTIKLILLISLTLTCTGTVVVNPDKQINVTPECDEDGDGFKAMGICGGIDCNDKNSYAYPGATEICDNGIDEDCNEEPDDSCLNCDVDGDGIRATGPSCGGTDCLDDNALAYPGAKEICENGKDDNCNDQTDENCDDPPIPGDPVDCSNPNVIFCADFEKANWKDDWDDYDGNPSPYNTVLEDSGPFRVNGNRVMRFWVPQNEHLADLVKNLPSSHDKLYLRYYYLWENGHDWSSQNHGCGMSALNSNVPSGYRPDGDDRFSISIEPYRRAGDLQTRLTTYSYYRGMYQDCSNPYGSCYGDSFPCVHDEGASYCEKAEHRDPPLTPTMETGRWYCIELMLDGGTPIADDGDGNNNNEDALADGQQSIFIDDVEYGPWQHLWHRITPDLKINRLWLKIYYHQDSHSSAGQRVDEIAVSTQRIGCGPLINAN